ncbi:MAG TPA: hypothetical protein VGI75_03495 [Pirellulales bacterium]
MADRRGLKLKKLKLKTRENKARIEKLLRKDFSMGSDVATPRQAVLDEIFSWQVNGILDDNERIMAALKDA